MFTDSLMNLPVNLGCAKSSSQQTSLKRLGKTSRYRLLAPRGLCARRRSRTVSAFCRRPFDEPITGAVIELHEVTKRFEGSSRVTALQAISLSIARGEMVAIIGPSGSGKSTLLNLVGGLDRPTVGDVRIDGESLTGLPDDALTRMRRDKVGFIFQFFNLLPTLTCLENVSLPLHLRGWPRRKVSDRARELLTLVRLGDRLTHLPEQLSGGQRQRVAIARALSIYPPILLADEPTGNLDTRTGEDVLSLIRDLHSRLGSTVVIVTHDMSVAERCQRTIQLRDGQVVDDVRRAPTGSGPA